MFAAFVFFGLRVAMRCEDRFGSLLAGGVTAMIGVQCVLNVAVVIGLMPVSYTHLDVYKRQGQRRVARFLDPEGAPGVGRADRPGIRDAYLLCLNGGALA